MRNDNSDITMAISIWDSVSGGILSCRMVNIMSDCKTPGLCECADMTRCPSCGYTISKHEQKKAFKDVDMLYRRIIHKLIIHQGKYREHCKDLNEHLQRKRQEAGLPPQALIRW